MVYYRKIGKIYNGRGIFLTVKQTILVILLEKGPLQNSEIAQKAGITEQRCSQTINTPHEEGLIESRFMTPRRINKLRKV
ncbi:MAG: winged helix-turn-helix transcriptional regulator [Candidatus Bathyarchaeia archaeon]